MSASGTVTNKDFSGLRTLAEAAGSRFQRGVGLTPASEIDMTNIVKKESLWYYFYIMCCFEFDHKKSSSNLNKHGIDFVEAQMLWDDPGLIEIQAKSDDEPRSLIIACIAQNHWSAVITYRGNAIRIISVRRSRESEVELYES